MYQYYTPVYSAEHFLSASEIAEKYGVYSVKGVPHGRLVKLLIANRINEFHHSYQLPVYYETKKGMMRVYSVNVYDEILKDFIKASGLVKGEVKTIEMIDGTKAVNFKYKIQQ